MQIAETSEPSCGRCILSRPVVSLALHTWLQFTQGENLGPGGEVSGTKASF